MQEQILEVIFVLVFMMMNLATQERFMRKELKKMRETIYYSVYVAGLVNLFTMSFMGLLVHLLYILFGKAGLKIARVMGLVIFSPLYIISLSLMIFERIKREE